MSNDPMAVTSVEGTITTVDGQTRQFRIALAHGAPSWVQWGNLTPQLGATVDLISALTEAASEYLTQDEDGNDENVWTVDDRAFCGGCEQLIEWRGPRRGQGWHAPGGGLSCTSGKAHHPLTLEPGRS